MTDRGGDRRRLSWLPRGRHTAAGLARQLERPAGRAGTIAVALGIVLALAVSGVVVYRTAADEQTLVDLTGAGEAPGAEGESAASVAAALAARPDSRTELGALRLDDPLDAAVAVLGPAARSAPDLNAAITYEWDLDDGVQVSITADDLGIVGVHADVPPEAPLEVRLHGDLLVGVSTPHDVVAAWGADHDLPVDGDDFVLRYTDCLGPFPVVIKFDQAGAAAPRWDAPVMAVHMAYADAEPGTHGCATA